MPTIAPTCAQVVLRLKELAHSSSHRVDDLHASLSERAAAGHRVRIEDISNFVDILQRDSNSPDIGLGCHELFHPGQLQSQLYPVMCSATLGEALTSLSQYSSLLSDGVPLLILEESESYSVVFLRLELLGLCRSYIDCYLATILGIVHWLLPLQRVVPVATAVSYDAPSDRHELEALFGRNLRFSNLVNKITFSARDWHQRLPTASLELKLHYERLLNAELQNTPVKMSSVVKNHIVVGLAKGIVVSLESIASALNLTPRMLRNRLDDELTGFRQLLDECRFQLASHLIGATGQGPATIAQSLGFTEISSFYRACNRWFGCSPGVYRLKAARARSPRAETVSSL
ncbi:DNA-binding domain-containing protein, AraC-type [Pseudomonas asplenii]|uniref:DNA-binding domain-containing protein, AraC-type n=1 Tax=Pseudomonas asplenii TaxID=53407 RepID=A0A0M9GFI1_9PSED|nr:AraC family transcriptional regulator [Pseudomonas fuscovaginae]KPA89655.1 DNA-binding domain-containing protein, AraC-type [Pseudomonas fuscovaginae]